jgi:CRP/FNR family transcriptional regulator, cyclic AMP receptor protein
MNAPIDSECAGVIAANQVMGLNRAGAEMLMLKSTRRRFAAKEVVFRNGELGDTMLILCSGRLASRTVSGRGDVTYVDVSGPGQFVGTRMVLTSNARHGTDMVALEPTVVRVLRRDAFDEILVEHPRILRSLIDGLLDQADRLTHRVGESNWEKADTRVRRRLVDLAENYEILDVCVITLTHDDIAAASGVTRPTASITVQAGEQAGVLKVGRGRITVPDLNALRAWAQ